jgi:nucleoside-diphosphate-sugar epimerase
MSVAAPRAVILGGTGLLGAATARRLRRSGWQVVVTGRHREHLPSDLTALGVAFAPVERHDLPALYALVGDGPQLLVDCLCYTAADATSLLPLAARAYATVMLSTKGVYADANGNHSNSDVPPRFDGPITEDQTTVAPGSGDHDSRDGYGANKVAAERVLLDSGLPISILRASKAHGRGTSRPREWVFVRRILERRPTLILANRGAGIDHPTAALNLAALIETVAHQPAARVLNCADPDAPSGLEIARTIADHLGYTWREILLDGNPQPPLGAYPWNTATPIVLDMTAANALGYQPVGTYAQTIVDELDWLVDTARRLGIDAVIGEHEAPFFARFLDYKGEDRFLRDLPKTRAACSSS